MADMEEKKDKFYLAINHYAEEQRKKIEEEIASYTQKELEETEVDVLTECYGMIQKEMAQMRGAISREMARREMDARRKLLEKRREITEAVFQKASEGLLEFAKTDGYAEFLKKAAGKFAGVFGRPGVVISLKPDDVKYEALIREAFGSDCSFQTDSTIEIGGLRAAHPDMGILADDTFDSLLEDQRGWFEGYSGMTVV